MPVEPCIVDGIPVEAAAQHYHDQNFEPDLAMDDSEDDVFGHAAAGF